jgi:hypothetical protein
MDEGKGHATVMFSKEELMLIEFCVTNALVRGNLDTDTAKDAVNLLKEIRLHLGNDSNGITERLGEKLRSILDERPG